MGASAVIGALRVNLGLNSAAFSSGIAGAKGQLGKFSSFAKGAFLAVAAAGLAVATAMGAMVKSAINSADEMSKTAQKAGVTVESLSRLAYAGNLSDVSLETLSGSLIKLSKGMAEIAAGKGAEVEAAFDALGVSALNLDGSMRAPDDVLKDIADKFAAMPDGAQKSALAVKLFGKSGAELIPLLNGGSAGLKQMADEADRFGITLDTKTAKSAEEFNDQLTRLQAMFQGIANKVMAAVLPALNQFAAVISDPKFAEAAAAVAQAIVKGMELAVKAILAVVDAYKTLSGWINWASTHDVFGNKLKPTEMDKARAKADLRQRLLGKSGVPELGEEATPYVPPAAWSKEDLAYPAVAKGGRLKQTITDTVTKANDLPKAFDKTAEAADKAHYSTKLMDEAVQEFRDHTEEAAEKAKSFGERVKDTFADIGSEISGLIDGTSTWQEALSSVLATLAKVAFQQLDFGGKSTGGENGIWGDVVGGLLKGIFNFAEGGSFKVGGAGGVDSQPVLFNASPDETVSVMTPQQMREAREAGNGDGRTINIKNVMNIQTPDVRSFKESEAQISGRLALMTRRGARTL